jgi:hypothetical protein
MNLVAVGKIAEALQLIERPKAGLNEPVCTQPVTWRAEQALGRCSCRTRACRATLCRKRSCRNHACRAALCHRIRPGGACSCSRQVRGGLYLCWQGPMSWGRAVRGYRLANSAARGHTACVQAYTQAAGPCVAVQLSPAARRPQVCSATPHADLLTGLIAKGASADLPVR